MAKNTISGYGVVELTKVASRKTGEIEAQAKLASGVSTLENGMIVFIDAENDKLVITKEVTGTYISAPYLHFSNPRRYDNFNSGMKNFIYENNEDYLPRVYKLTAGDIFVTNLVDTNNSATAEGTATPVAGVLTLDGPSGTPGNFYIKPSSMPDGSAGFEVRYLG